LNTTDEASANWNAANNIGERFNHASASQIAANHSIRAEIWAVVIQPSKIKNGATATEAINADEAKGPAKSFRARSPLTVTATAATVATLAKTRNDNLTGWHSSIEWPNLKASICKMARDDKALPIQLATTFSLRHAATNAAKA
jgi:hypothetical protein